MEFHHHHHNSGGSPSSSTTTASSTDPTPNHHNNGSHHNTTSTTSATTSTDPMHTWWESISKARARIHLLSTLLPTDPTTISSLADSDRPARSLLSSLPAYTSLSSSLTSPNSGSGSDPLCHWLYDTFLSSDPDLRLVVLSFIPIVAGTYLSRIHSQNSTSARSLAGFEAVLLSLYSSETKSRAGKPILVTIPDLSQPSLYHTPRPTTTTTKQNPNPNPSRSSNQSLQPLIGVLSPPLEPQTAIKSTKRACIVGVALDCYYKQISQLPSWSKLDFCKFASSWAGQTCPCTSEFDQVKERSETNTFSNGINIEEADDDDGIVEELQNLEIVGSDELDPKGVRILLPWELLQPVLRIVGHCLLAPLNGNDVKDAASVAVRSLYARATHDLVPQAILATRSLIQLDRRARDTVQAAAVVANVASNATTPTKVKKPEILLVSK